MKSITNLVNSKFGKNIMVIAGGTAFAQVITLILSPFITRIYSPDEFGMLTVFSAIVGVFAVYSSLRYERTIPITGSIAKSINMLMLSFIILTAFTISVGIILMLLGGTVLNLFEGALIYEYRMLIPVAIFLFGSHEILNQWALKEKNFKAIGKTKLSQSIVGNGLKIGLGVIGLGPLGLIIGRIASDSAGLTFLSKSLIKNKRYFSNVSIKNMRWGVKRYYHFPVYSGPSKFMHNLTTQLPVVFLASLFGGEIAGLYGLASSVIKMPMALIGTSVANVFYGEIANLGKDNPEKIKNLTKKLQKKLLLIGSIPLIILLLFGPILFSLVFGEEWYQAGEYARLLSFVVFFNFTMTPISNVASVFEKMKETLWIALFRLLLIFVVFGASMIFSLNSFWTIGLYSFAMSINYLTIYFFAQWVIKNAIKEKNNKSEML